MKNTIAKIVCIVGLSTSSFIGISNAVASSPYQKQDVNLQDVNLMANDKEVCIDLFGLQVCFPV